MNEQNNGSFLSNSRWLKRWLALQVRKNLGRKFFPRNRPSKHINYFMVAEKNSSWNIGNAHFCGYLRMLLYVNPNDTHVRDLYLQHL